MNLTKKSLLAATAVALSLSLTSCSDDKKDEPTKEDTPSATASPTKNPAEGQTPHVTEDGYNYTQEDIDAGILPEDLDGTNPGATKPVVTIPGKVGEVFQAMQEWQTTPEGKKASIEEYNKRELRLIKEAGIDPAEYYTELSKY